MKSKKGFQTMEDEKIVELYLLRNEEALGASKVKYGRMLLGLSQALLWNREDSEECENDTYLTAWNRIPPDRPSFLGAYLSKIVRYLSLNLLRKRNAGKRPETVLVLEELEECIPSSESGSIPKSRLREAFCGISLVILSTSLYGSRITRATSLKAALVAIVPKVTIWATLGAPYFPMT